MGQTVGWHKHKYSAYQYKSKLFVTKITLVRLSITHTDYAVFKCTRHYFNTNPHPKIRHCGADKISTDVLHQSR